MEEREYSSSISTCKNILTFFVLKITIYTARNKCTIVFARKQEAHYYSPSLIEQLHKNENGRSATFRQKSYVAFYVLLMYFSALLHFSACNTSNVLFNFKLICVLAAHPFFGASAILRNKDKGQKVIQPLVWVLT